LRKQAETYRARGDEESAAKLDKLAVGLDMLKGGLTPSDSALGTIANTAAPLASYGIGQYAKAHGSEGSPAHIIAHATLAGLTAAANGGSGTDIATSAGTAAAAEFTAPYLAKQLYGTSDSRKLTAEQKETLSSILGLAAAGAGAAVGNSATAYDASRAVGNAVGNAVENNKVNVKQAGTIDGFKEIFDNSPTKMGKTTGKDAEISMLRLSEVKGIKPSVTPYFNQKNHRYIYTEEGGWIDMVHFLFYASKAYSEKQDLIISNYTNSFGGYPDYEKIANASIAEAIQSGYMQEKLDTIMAPHSAYSFEDLPTDKYGAIFGARYFNPDSSKTFGEQLKDYFSEQLKATEPINAPNFNTLPEIDDGTSSGIINKTTKPMFIGNKNEK